jgi:hypothetical protein
MIPFFDFFVTENIFNIGYNSLAASASTLKLELELAAVPTIKIGISISICLNLSEHGFSTFFEQKC